MSNYTQLSALGIKLNRTSGSLKTLCPKCSHTRKKKNDPCLSVNIDTGVYNCFNCHWSGGVKQYTRENTQKQVYFQPKWENHTDLPERVVKWFSGRGISQNTLLKLKVTHGMAWMPQTGKDESCIKFNYFRENQLINVKYRDGRKNFRLEKGAELILYNIDAIGISAVICEGEIDALSYIEAGIEYATSVPNGANKNLEYLDNCIDNFDKCERIYIAADQDEKGRTLKEELVRRLGEERCYIVDFKDCKDANEYLIKYGAIELHETISKANPCAISGIIYANQISDSVFDLYRNGMPPGDKIGIDQFDPLMSFVGGYITTIVGIPSHGKSEFADEVIVRLAKNHGWKWGVYSPENYPFSYHISKWSEKLTGLSFRGNNQYQRMSELHVNKSLKFIENHLFFISPESEDFSLQSILEHAKKLVRRNGIRGLIIDPWNRLEHQRPNGMSETEYIGSALDQIDNFSKKNNVHTILVVHPRKMEKNKDGKYEVPTLYDCAGSANFYNKSANGISVYRNFEDGSDSTDIFVMKVKFKHWGEKGSVRMVYNKMNGRYTPFTSMEDKANWLADSSEQQTEMTANNNFLTESKPIITNDDKFSDMPF